jgi:hypothetical protein
MGTGGGMLIPNAWQQRVGLGDCRRSTNGAERSRARRVCSVASSGSDDAATSPRSATCPSAHRMRRGWQLGGLLLPAESFAATQKENFPRGSDFGTFHVSVRSW